jgi:hypothetical protein
VVHRGVDFARDAARVLEEDAPGRKQAHALSVSLEERAADLLLQRAQPAAQPTSSQRTQLEWHGLGSYAGFSGCSS